MTIYAYLTARFGHKPAAVLTGLWLATLLSLVLLFGGTPETTLRYLSL